MRRAGARALDLAHAMMSQGVQLVHGMQLGGPTHTDVRAGW